MRGAAFLGVVALGATVAGCDVPEIQAFQVPAGGSAMSGDVAIEVTEAREVALPAHVIRARFSERIAVGPAPVCDVAAVILPKLAMTYECQADGGTVTMGGLYTSAEALFASFVRAVRRTGAPVEVGPGWVGIGPGGAGSVGGFSGSAPDGASEDVNGVEAYTTAGATTGVAASGFFANTDLISRRIGATPERIVQLAQVARIDVRAVPDGDGAIAFGTPYSLGILEDLMAGGGTTVASVARNGIPPSALEVIARENLVTVTDEPDYGRIIVVGESADVANAVGQVHSLGGSGGDIRFEAAFVRVSSRAIDSAGIRIGAAFKVGDLNLTLGETVEAGDDIVAVASALSDKGRDGVEIRPTVTAAVGAPARFVDGAQVPVVLSTRSDDGDTVADVEYRPTGTVLDVRGLPQPDGTVRVQVIVEVSEVIGEGVQGSPVFATRSVNTVVTLGAGEMVLLSGLNSETAAASRTIGTSFGRSRRSEASQLGILLRATQAGGPGKW